VLVQSESTVVVDMVVLVSADFNQGGEDSLEYLRSFTIGWPIPRRCLNTTTATTTTKKKKKHNKLNSQFNFFSNLTL
jgi:hypothetical protein